MRYLTKMFLLSIRYVLHILTMTTFLHICEARSLANESSTTNTTDGSLWQPKEGTREEWMACRGMPKDVCERTRLKKQELLKALAKKFGIDDIKPSASPLQDASPSDSGKGQCIMYTEEQLDMMIAEAKNEGQAKSADRKKRSLIDFKTYTYSKWSMPVPYMFDGTHDANQKVKIRAAFRHWADSTCIRFRELPTNAVFHSNYILMTKNESDGCHSNVGRRSDIPQQINLESTCVEVFGSVLHEIGHSLGLVHEQSRLGRNESIRILWNNIQMDSWPQYLEVNYTDALGLSYNYGSVMHYPAKSGKSVNVSSDTMLALQPLYQMNMGQRSDLSFHDRKIINLGYCKEFCTTPLTQPCQRSGYQNPNNCSTCICPDGFSGQYCNEIAQPQNASCGGILNIVSGTQQIIKSPGYDTTGYSDQEECDWWIKAPMDYTLELTFSGSFAIFCQSSSCKYHWVEIKYKKDLGLEGARFCCYDRPNNTVKSESNEIMVIFRSIYSLGQTKLRGFEAIVKSIPPAVSNSSRSTSTPASTSHTSTPVSTKIIPISTLTNSSTASAQTSSVSNVFSATTTESSGSTKTTSSNTTTAVRPVSSRSSPTSNPAVGAVGCLLLSVLLQLRYLSCY